MLTEQKYRLIHVLGGILFGPIKLREPLNLVWNSYFFFKEKSLISHRVSISHHLKTRSKETSKTNVVQMRAYVLINKITRLIELGTAGPGYLIQFHWFLVQAIQCLCKHHKVWLLQPYQLILTVFKWKFWKKDLILLQHC